MSMKLKIWIALLIVYIVWGGTYLGIRYAVETIPPFLMAGTRFLLSGAILYVWRRLAGDPAPTRSQWLQAAVVGLLLLLCGNGLVSLAEQSVASGIAALLVGSAPLWMTIFEALRPGAGAPECPRDRWPGHWLRRHRPAGSPRPDEQECRQLPPARDCHPVGRRTFLVAWLHLQPHCPPPGFLPALHRHGDVGRGRRLVSGRDSYRRMAPTRTGQYNHPVPGSA